MDADPIDDDDNPKWTEDDFARALPASEVHSPAILRLLVRHGAESQLIDAVRGQDPLARGWSIAA
jgi:hypothetical protein